MTAQGLPFNHEAERFLLASVLRDETLLPQAVSITEKDFSTEWNKQAWRRIRQLRERGEPVDTIAVFHEMERHGDGQGLSNLSLLSSLSDNVPHVSSIEGRVRVVKDKSTMRQIIEAAQNLMDRAYLGIETPDEILESGRETILKFAQNRAESSLETPEAIIEGAGGLTVYLDRKQRKGGLKSGFTQFDGMSSGFAPGKLYVIGARPRMGKTALILNMAEHVSVKNDDVSLIFSLEMDKESLVDRMICSRARVNTKKFETGYMDFEESRRVSKAAGEIMACDRLLIDDRAGTSMEEIHAKVRKQILRRPVGLVIIDYLQLMMNGSEKYRVGEMSKISRDAKLLAKDCKIPVIGLSQLNRECDTRPNHRPELSDLRESGSIEQDADLVAFLYREEVYEPDREDLKGHAELIIAKQRSGPEGTIPLVWLKQIVRFENVAREEPWRQ